MKTCIRLESLAWPVTLTQSGAGGKLFTVTYGAQVERGLTYSEACKSFGKCVFHALACEGLLDNEGA